MAAGGDLHRPGDAQGQAAAVLGRECDRIVQAILGVKCSAAAQEAGRGQCQRAYAGAPHKVSAGDLARHRMSSFTFLYTGVAAYFSSWFDSITGGAVCQSKPRI